MDEHLAHFHDKPISEWGNECHAYARCACGKMGIYGAQGWWATGRIKDHETMADLERRIRCSGCGQLTVKLTPHQKPLHERRPSPTTFTRHRRRR